MRCFCLRPHHGPVAVAGRVIAAMLMTVVVGAAPALAESTPGTHDGIAVRAVFLRAALGAGLVTDKVQSHDFTNANLPVPANMRGSLEAAGAAGQLEIGYSLRPGLALGVGSYFQQVAWARAHDVTVRNSLSDEVLFRYDYRFKASLITLIAPFIDWYPFSTGGLHLEGGVGLAILTLGNGHHVVADRAPTLHKMHGNGLLVMAGVGYEVWVASKCSMGLLVRLLAGWGDADGLDGIPWSNSVYAPSLLFTTTFD